MSEQEFKFVFLVSTTDETVADSVREAFGDADVSESDNFIGGSDVAVFLKATASSLVGVFGKILDFKAAKDARLGATAIVIGKEKIELRGYTKDDAEALLALEPVRMALDSLDG